MKKVRYEYAPGTYSIDATVENGVITIKGHRKNFWENPVMRKEGLEKARRLAASFTDAPDGVYWRGTDNKKEISILAKLKSRDHSTGQAEKGVSVSKNLGGSAFHGYPYYYQITGDMVGVGADGEPVLVNIRAASRLMSLAEAKKLEESQANYPEGWDKDTVRLLMRGDLDPDTTSDLAITLVTS